MSSVHPWEVGDHESRWEGYFIAPGSPVLRNRLGIEELEALADAENDLVEFRITQLRERPRLIRRSYDLVHLQELHRHLFQDVYEWAGDLRTVGLAKDGGESFMPPAQIELPVNHVSQRVRESDYLKLLKVDELSHEVAYLYDYLNFAHPFREGNGRTQREFFSQLLSDTGYGLNWQLIAMKQLHEACHTARNDGGLAPHIAVFERILVRQSGPE